MSQTVVSSAFRNKKCLLLYDTDSINSKTKKKPNGSSRAAMWGNIPSKRTFSHAHQMKTQISLRIRAVWSESSLYAWWKFASLAIQNAPSEYADQTARMRRLIWVFALLKSPMVWFLTFRFSKSLCISWIIRWLSWMRARLLIRKLRVRPPPGRQHSSTEMDHEIYSKVIPSLPLIQEGQLPVSGERMCRILVYRLEDLSCPVKVWLAKLTALEMTQLGWLGGKISTQTNKQNSWTTIFAVRI